MKIFMTFLDSINKFIRKNLSKFLSAKEKNVSGDVDITKMIDELKKKQKRMNEDLVNQALQILREAEKKFGVGVFTFVKVAIEKKILSEPLLLTDMIAKKATRGWFIRECIYTMIADISKSMLRNLSSSIKKKELLIDLLKIYDATISDLVSFDAISIEEARKLKTDIRKETNVWPK